MAHIYKKGDEPVPGFRLISLLGRGGFGEVWKATGPGGTQAAIKVIDVGEKQGYKEFRAVRLVKEVRHPNLIPIIAFWLKDINGNFFDDEVSGGATIAVLSRASELLIAMGLGDKNLLDRLKECQAEGMQGIPTDELLNYMHDSAKAIDFLNQQVHDLGSGPVAIQHCDIKPQNILIVSGGAQVCDFGLARVLGDARVTSAAGSAAYMAPELITDSKPSATTDQYSLAISYYELRTGQLPFDTVSPAAVIYSHVNGKLNLTKLPPAEQTVIRKATSVDPSQRYATTIEMVRALRRAIGSTPTRSEYQVVPPSQGLKPDQEIVPGYRLIQCLGQGSYGEVWEASAPGGRRVALKIIRNLEQMRGHDEFRVLDLIRTLDHDHLMELQSFWLFDRQGQLIPDEIRNSASAPEPGMAILATMLANENLSHVLEARRQAGNYGIPVAELLGYLREAATALDYLNTPRHTLGNRKVAIQHRDIKPENILLLGGSVKLSDFAMAAILEDETAPIRYGREGITVAYAAPEVFRGVVTSTTDQYALAITYFQLRTGALPFPAGLPSDRIARIHMSGQISLQQLPEAEQKVIAKATLVDPKQRFHNCRALVQALENACGFVPRELRTSKVARPTIPEDNKGAEQIPTIAIPTIGPSAESQRRSKPKQTAVAVEPQTVLPASIKETLQDEGTSPPGKAPKVSPPHSVHRPRRHTGGSSANHQVLTPSAAASTRHTSSRSWKGNQGRGSSSGMPQWLTWVGLLAVFALLGAVVGVLIIVILMALAS